MSKTKFPQKESEIIDLLFQDELSDGDSPVVMGCRR